MITSPARNLRAGALRCCYNPLVARVLMVSSEAAPLAKTGGLADVVGSLPTALQSYGDDVAVVMPRYGSIPSKHLIRVADRIPVHIGIARYETAVYRAGEEFPLFLVDCPDLFDRPGFYGEAGIDYPDNHIRFAVFARAALSVARYLFRTDVFHCHDWQSGLVPAYLRTIFANDPTFLAAKTLFTIHNLGYQGLFPASAVDQLALDPVLFRPEGAEFFGSLSFLKSGIAFSDALNTVSPTYAMEIQTPEYGFGLDGVLRARAGVLTGILNGVDYREWNPESDRFLAAHYSARDLSGKRFCKQRLLEEFGLPLDAMERPLIGLVSRFTRQKGADLIAQVSGGIVAEDAYLIALGNGDPEYEEFFSRMAADFPGRIAVRIGFDEALAHRIEGGADMFLMPSQYEPCGLNQIYSLKYGTVPIVRATGGLDDTIKEETGFKFREYTGVALLEAIREAVRAFSNPIAWRAMMLCGMAQDFSWKTSAAAYSALYRDLLSATESH